ncbi:MAG: hypothetical protein V7776_12190 [Halopseudomonas aestusnigri]
MKERNDWQAFYRQQVRVAEQLHQNLHRLGDVLPPRIRRSDTRNSKPEPSDQKLVGQDAKIPNKFLMKRKPNEGKIRMRMNEEKQGNTKNQETQEPPLDKTALSAFSARTY